MNTVQSADGTTIAYERLGEGDRPPVIVVGGALCDRGRMRPVCAALAAHATVFNYDRRGRGDSGEGDGHDVAREIEDIAALVGEAGGSAAIYGHSSGAALVLRAALRGLPLDKVVLHDPPFGPDDAEQREVARAYDDELRTLVVAGRDGDAVALFMRLTGMPAEAVEAMRGEPWFAATAALGPSLLHDSAAMSNVERAGTVPLDLIADADVTFPTLVLVGDANPPFFVDAGRRLAEALPDARLRLLEGEGHVVDPETLVPPVADFVTA
ncbi:MAG: alpha/beta hydrolase [Solirubrobacteraceae bacterium]